MYCRLKMSPLIQKGRFQEPGFVYVRITETPHFRAVRTGNFSDYRNYMQQSRDREHSVRRFQQLIRTFDEKKLETIEILCSVYFHDAYVVTDGIHRLAILTARGQTHLPHRSIRPLFDMYAIVSIQKGLMETTDHSLPNGWNNRTRYGYHSFDIGNLQVQGQRNSKQRIQLLKQHISFDDAVVLDFGCNTGGMLLHLDTIRRGYGFEYDTTCIHIAKEIAKRALRPVFFYQADLNTIRYHEFKTPENPNIVFLLSLGSWISKWKELYAWSIQNADVVVLETNNDTEGKEQLDFFSPYSIQCISEASTDDRTGNRERKLYLVRKK